MMHRAHRQPDPAPPPISGFEGVRRLWDPEHHRWSVKILPGELFVTPYDESISAIVGSCLSVCIRDPALRIGGMTHFILPLHVGTDPDSPTSDPGGVAMRYGRSAMQRLVDEVLKLGAKRDRLKAKMYGGGRNIASSADVSAKTIAFTRKFLREQGLPLVAEQLGDSRPRRVMYFPSTGMALVHRLPSRYTAAVANREMQYFKSVGGQPVLEEKENMN